MRDTGRADPVYGDSSAVAAHHFEELRSAINAIRAAAGLPAASWASILPSMVPAPAGGGVVHDDQVLSLRTAMNTALEAHGIASGTYTHTLSGPTFVYATHLRQLQERTK